MSVFNFPLYTKDALNSQYCYRLIAFNFSFLSKRYAWFYTMICNDIKTKNRATWGKGTCFNFFYHKIMLCFYLQIGML